MDAAIVRELNSWMSSSVVSWIAVFLSSQWMLLGTTAPLAVVLLRKKRYAAILTIALAMGATDAINARIIKPVVARERPCRAIDDLILPVKCGAGRSFASGHSAVAFAFAVTASPSVRFGWYIFPLLAFLVAWSRVLLGAHYPTDITAGAIFGASIGAVALAMKRKFTAPSPSPRDPPATSEPVSPPQ